MLNKLHTFVFKLLTTSQEVSLRRLRSYAVSIGGMGELYQNIPDLMASFSEDKLPSIVLIDSTCQLTDETLTDLRAHCKVMIIDSTSFNTKPPKLGHQIYDVVTYIQGTLLGFLNAPICRINAAKLCDQNSPLELTTLLRWGHARLTWTQANANTATEVGHKFIKNYRLTSNWRSTVEMFCHFSECLSKKQIFANLKVDFASDGLMLASVLRCKVKGDIKEAIYKINSELRVYRFSIAAINQISEDELEIATYFCPTHHRLNPAIPVILIYNQFGLVVEIDKPDEPIQDLKEWEDAG